MPRWLGPPEPPEPPDRTPKVPTRSENVTDDPLAAINPGQARYQKIYSVSRSVFLPRVKLKIGTLRGTSGGGVNPLFVDTNDRSSPSTKKPQNLNQRYSSYRDKSTSSGYGDSSSEAFYQDHLKLMEDVGVILERNPAFVKSIRIASRGLATNRNVSCHSSSSGGGTLTTIPEGEVDQPIPEPIWPLHDKKLLNQYDSLVDDALLLYTSLNYKPDRLRSLETYLDISVKDLLLELLHGINETLEGKNHTRPEEMLKIVDEQIRLKLQLLRASTEEEVKRLCVNMSNCKKKNSVLRALSNTSSSGNSSNSRIRTISLDTEDIYLVPSASSSSGFSDSLKDSPSSPSAVPVPLFVHEDLTRVPNLVRNAMIYGTLCRGKEALLKKTKKIATLPRKLSSLKAVSNEKPSVWQQYYGVKAVEEGEIKHVAKPADVPLFPGGRPEADFTLDLPRSDHLLKRMKEDKKWRCRCRVLTSFLGLVFFLLSVMAVSLILTRGKRMFGSMV